MRDYRFVLPMMRGVARGEWGWWHHRSDKRVRAWVLDRIRAEDSASPHKDNIAYIDTITTPDANTVVMELGDMVAQALAAQGVPPSREAVLAIVSEELSAIAHAMNGAAGAPQAAARAA